MIYNDQELAVVRKQLGRAQSALAALRKRVKNERNFAVYSEGPVDQIAELKAEIEAYEEAANKNGKTNGKNGKRGRRKAS